MTQTTLILGATSAMAEHTARLLASDGDTLLLAARRTEALDILAADLTTRGAAEVKVLPAFDALSPDTFPDLLAAAGSFDRVLIAYGNLPDQAACEADPSKTVEQIELNMGSVIRLCTLIANRFSEQGHGTLAVISSVAGLRGRQSNYVYGTAKGGLNLFLQGLRNRLAPKGIRVLTLLPGFVDTPMTADNTTAVMMKLPCACS
jgi:decaprenylphospho-beta-D-erythro-pentofuranosid-2-ulose 2-reductase